MAEIRLADLGYEPQTYNNYFIQMTTTTTSMINSGLVDVDPMYNEKASADGMRLASIPFINDIDGESNISSDDPTEFSTPKKITTGRDTCVITRRNDSWKAMDYLKSVIKSPEALVIVANRLVNYWERDRQKALTSIMQGITQSNIDNNSGDMVTDVGHVTTGIKYHTYFFAPKAIAMGFGRPANPLAVERTESSGNGEGDETLFTRHHYLLHPKGIKWTDADTDQTKTPTNADFANPLNWLRVYERQYVKMAVAVTNAKIEGTVTSDNCLNPDVIIDTLDTMGEHVNQLTFMMCHSKILSYLRKLDLITDVPYSQQNGISGAISYYGGVRIILSNSVYHT